MAHLPQPCWRANSSMFASQKVLVKQEQAGGVKHDILVSPPNRLVHLLEQGLLSLDNLQWLVVDEADKMFEAGVTGFRFCISV